MFITNPKPLESAVVVHFEGLLSRRQGLCKEFLVLLPPCSQQKLPAGGSDGLTDQKVRDFLVKVTLGVYLLYMRAFKHQQFLPQKKNNKMKPTNPNAHTYDNEPRNHSYEMLREKRKAV